MRTISFFYNNGLHPTGEALGDIVVDETGIVNAFNGTGNPFMTRYDPATAAFAHSSFPSWNTSQGGGIATYGGQYVYVSDSSSAGAPSGIVRFDLVEGTAARFAEGLSVLDLAVAGGKLYALHATVGTDATHINVYEPRSMALLQQMYIRDQADPVRRMAVASDGRIYLCGLGFYVFRLSAAGVVQDLAHVGFNYLNDIAVNDDGVVVIARSGGNLIFTDTAFSAFRSVSMQLGSISTSAFVALAPPLPEPPPLQLEKIVSRKTHDPAGVFDIEMPLDRSTGVECRAKTSNGFLHTVVLRFNNELANVTQAGVVQGTGQWYLSLISADRHEYVLNLAGVTDGQSTTVQLTGVTDVAGNNVERFTGTLHYLFGDVTGNGVVNAGDVSYVRAQAGKTVTSDNFWADLNLDGAINAADTALAKSASGRP